MDKPSVTICRTLPHQPEEVWDRLTSPEGFESWMGDGSTIDTVPGGQLVAADVESGEPKIGEVLEVDPGERVRWAWRPLGNPEQTTEVEIEVAHAPDDGSEGSGTRITVTERPSIMSVRWAGSGQACAVNAVAIR